jgi:sortase A
MSVNISKRTILSLFAGSLALSASIYFLCTVTAPHLDTLLPPTTWNTPVTHKKEVKLTANRLYLPKLKLNLPYKAGDASVLNDNIWHRLPQRGDPKKGGNFILAGHRFELGFSPGETRYKSPFYQLDRIVVGDKIFVDFDGERYQYRVVRRFVVKPNDTSIENPSHIAKMTLYSCTLGGTWDGRDVVEAVVTKKNVNPTVEF